LNRTVARLVDRWVVFSLVTEVAFVAPVVSVYFLRGYGSPIVVRPLVKPTANPVATREKIMPFSLIRIVYISTGLLHIGWYDINLWCAAAAAAAAAVDDTLMDAVNHQTPVTPRVLTSSLDDLDKPAIQELTGTYTPDTLVYTKSDEIASRSGRRVDVNACKIPQVQQEHCLLCSDMMFQRILVFANAPSFFLISISVCVRWICVPWCI
jgi:hypothetical protein